VSNRYIIAVVWPPAVLCGNQASTMARDCKTNEYVTSLLHVQTNTRQKTDFHSRLSLSVWLICQSKHQFICGELRAFFP